MVRSLVLSPLKRMGFWGYQQFLTGIVYPSIWIAAAIASLAGFAQLMMGLALDWRPIALVFATALVPYNLDRLLDAYWQPVPQLQAYFRNNGGILGLLLVAVAGSAYLLVAAPPAVRYASCAGIVPLLYGVPLLPLSSQNGRQWYRLKDIPGSKAWIVCSTLTYATVGLPLAYAGAHFDEAATLTALFLFAFIACNSHAFDIRDLDADGASGVTTLPCLAGVRGTKLILSALYGLVLLALLWGWRHGAIDCQIEVLLATACSWAYLWAVDRRTPRWVYDIAIDGVLFVPALAAAVVRAA
ncbi:MAG: prenyltransferase [Cyanobacteria bacterium QS_8_64_29]|nr:MAG: prenyltransferase [Cyanobacteria bacterium QS_8_64_29]